jgi:hypothetical protein
LEIGGMLATRRLRANHTTNNRQCANKKHDPRNRNQNNEGHEPLEDKHRKLLPLIT